MVERTVRESHTLKSKLKNWAHALRGRFEEKGRGRDNSARHQHCVNTCSAPRPAFAFCGLKVNDFSFLIDKKKGIRKHMCV